MINAFMEARIDRDKDKVNKLYEEFDNEIRSRSAKFLEELKESNQKIKDTLESSTGFTDETIERELAKLDKQFEEDREIEGKYTKGLLKELEIEREETLNGIDDSNLEEDKYEKNEEIAKSENNDKKMPESDNKNKQSENENKQSPIDYIIEKYSEMPDTSDSDLGE